MSVAAIIPAYNEEQTIGAVIHAIRDAKMVDDIIVVSDGSTDGTSAVARQAGATVIALEKNQGKGEAMRRGVAATDANILFFCDADLVGLQPYHVKSIIAPVREGRGAMCIGLRDRFGIPALVARLDALMAIGGERAVRRDIFTALGDEELEGYSVEVALNAYCQRKRLQVIFVAMTGVTHRLKELKWGGKGFYRRFLWFAQIFLMRIRALFVR